MTILLLYAIFFIKLYLISVNFDLERTNLDLSDSVNAIICGFKQGLEMDRKTGSCILVVLLLTNNINILHPQCNTNHK